MSRITTRISTMAMMLKQIEEMLQPTPGRVAAAVLTPSAPIAIASVATQGGTRVFSRFDANQRRAAPTRSVAESASRMRARRHARGRESRRLSFRAEHARSACEVEESQTVGIEALGRDASRFL